MKENFKNIDNFLNHICNYDNKTKENLLDFIIGVKYREQKILNIVGYNMTGKTTFVNLMNKVNKLRKFVPFVISELENYTMDILTNDNLARPYVKDLLYFLPLYGNLIIVTLDCHELSKLFIKVGESLDNLETMHINNSFIKTKEEIDAILDNDEINAFAEFLDNEFERRTNLKIENTKPNLKYIEEFDYFLPINLTTKNINRMYIADILFNQYIHESNLRKLLECNKLKNNKLKNDKEMHWICELLPSPRPSDVLRFSNFQNLDEIINELKDISEE